MVGVGVCGVVSRSAAHIMYMHRTIHYTTNTTGIGEASMLGLTSQYHGPSTITAWSSGTGFAGVVDTDSMMWCVSVLYIHTHGSVDHHDIIRVLLPTNTP